MQKGVHDTRQAKEGEVNIAFYQLAWGERLRTRRAEPFEMV